MKVWAPKTWEILKVKEKSKTNIVVAKMKKKSLTKITCVAKIKTYEHLCLENHIIRAIVLQKSHYIRNLVKKNHHLLLSDNSRAADRGAEDSLQKGEKFNPQLDHD